ncbi:hypothetical protein F4553_000113 [Allocatelliglobosispora scoriae]|uniref:Acyl-protein synthetase LuxE domain-containing protein n=1 Tax=Allocatelliglobosispora scoriae TaxID=643052 RepID=A0A841BEL5_9ACTN|nr:acyl-protein synthetase [Allocatelliglobosispora scoriae]MBB5866734.1 hypothetical protein [Allocatelliglobosispora scoriae]
MFTLRQADREARLTPQLTDLTGYHRAACPGYANLLAALGHPAGTSYERPADFAWLPVRLFKEHLLTSVPTGDVAAVLTSSGTTGSERSQVTLDLAAAHRQRSHLIDTLRFVVGPRRLPLLVVDSPRVIAEQRSSIRGATVLGVLGVGRDHAFALDRDGELDLAAVTGFLARHGRQPFLIFGFTYLVWSQLYPVAVSHGLDLREALLLHTGGWKKLADIAVSPARFRTAWREAAGLTRVQNFYGMVEQGGTIYVESPDGQGLHCPDIADVIIRDPRTWAEAPTGTAGVIEVLSVVPRSHPGHVLLTEDLGVVHGIDDGQWPGKRFEVLGRLSQAEPRGCSDTLLASGDAR